MEDLLTFVHDLSPSSQKSSVRILWMNNLLLHKTVIFPSVILPASSLETDELRIIFAEIRKI